MKCDNCRQIISRISDVRGCSRCQANGTAAMIHARFKDSDPIEDAVCCTTGLPFHEPQLDPAPPPPTKKPGRIRKLVDKALGKKA